MSARIAEVPYSDAALELGGVSDAYLAANNLSRERWEAMVARELAKMNPPKPQPDLFT